MFACTWICVKVDLKKGLSKAILLTLNNWKHYQKLDYEQLPFKYKTCLAFREELQEKYTTRTSCTR